MKRNEKKRNQNDSERGDNTAVIGVDGTDDVALPPIGKTVPPVENNKASDEDQN